MIRHGELKDLIVPLISIDEFQAKTGDDNEVIVIAFFLRDEMAAYDLDDFIDKGTVDVLDSEVSPNPNEDGFWVVFVEFHRKPNFWFKLYELVKDVENLSTKLNWEVQPYKHPRLFDLYDKKLFEIVPTTKEAYGQLRMDSDILEYLEYSDLEDCQIDEGTLTFVSSGAQVLYDLVDFGREDNVIKRQKLDEATWDPTKSNPRAQILSRMLGPEWKIASLDKYLVLSNEHDPRILVLN